MYSDVSYKLGLVSASALAYELVVNPSHYML